jgi:hypothetical protein
VIGVPIPTRLLFRTIMDEDLVKICTSLGIKKNQYTFIWYFDFNSLIPQYSMKSSF